MLSQNHSWNGLTRPARINDNLPPAAAGSPEQRCRVDPQPGTLAALRTRLGYERGAPGAARWVCGGQGGWEPGREGAAGLQRRVGRGPLLGAAGTPFPRRALPLSGWEWRRPTAISNPRWGRTEGPRDTGAGVPGLTAGRAAASLPAGTLELCRQLFWLAPCPATPVGSFRWRGEGTARHEGLSGREWRTDADPLNVLPPKNLGLPQCQMQNSGVKEETRALTTRSRSRGPDRSRN